MNEMTPPVQKNFYAVGMEYNVKFAGAVRKAKYIGEFRLSDGTVEHIFAYEYFNTDAKRPFAMDILLHDDWSADYIKGDA